MDPTLPQTEPRGPQPRPKRHHYLPKFYLDGFTTNGLVALYDRERKEFRRQAPKNTALENSFYSAQTDSGERFDDVETAFALLESDAKPIVDRLEDGFSISQDERDVIAMFAAAFFVRTPGFRRSTDNLRERFAKDVMRRAVGNVDRAKRQMEEMRAAGVDLGEVPPDVIASFFRDGEYRLKFSQNESLKEMVSLLGPLGAMLSDMQLRVLRAPLKKTFLTCDEPFLLFPPKEPVLGVGIATPGAKKILPLTSHVSLVFGDIAPRSPIVYAGAHRRWTRLVNLTLAKHSQRFVLGAREALVRSVVESVQLDSLTPQDRFRLS